MIFFKGGLTSGASLWAQSISNGIIKMAFDYSFSKLLKLTVFLLPWKPPPRTNSMINLNLARSSMNSNLSVQVGPAGGIGQEAMLGGDGSLLHNPVLLILL